MISFRNRVVVLLAVASAGVAAAGVAHAQDGAATASVRSGQTLRTADGRQLGPIDRVDFPAGSSAGTASVILGDRFVHIPTSTISLSQKGAVTSLSLADVRKLN